MIGAPLSIACEETSTTRGACPVPGGCVGGVEVMFVNGADPNTHCGNKTRAPSVVFTSLAFGRCGTETEN